MISRTWKKAKKAWSDHALNERIKHKMHTNKNTLNKQRHTRHVPKTKLFEFRYQNWFQLILKVFDNFALFHILSKEFQKVGPQFLIAQWENIFFVLLIL